MSRSNPLSKVGHYWEYMTIQFSELDSVKYINFYYDDASTSREKALGWILLAITLNHDREGTDLSRVFLEVFSNIPILQLYKPDDSYFWQNRKEVLECAKAIARKDLHSPCPLLDRFFDY